MIKSLLSNIIIVFSLLFSLTVKGENNLEGTWYFHPTYTTPPQKVLETDRERVYYLSGGNLFSYDNKDDENYAYTINNKLSDSDITNIITILIVTIYWCVIHREILTCCMMMGVQKTCRI